MNIIFVIQYTASLLFLWLIFFVLYKNPKAVLNRTCALLLGCFVIWNFFTAYHYTAKTEEIAMLLLNISSIGWCSFPSFALWFALVFTGKEKLLRKWYFYFFILIIPAFFIYKQWTGYLYNHNIKEYYGWTDIWSNSIWNNIFYVYYFSFMLISISLCYFFILKAKNSFEKKQARIIVITGITPIVLGSITDILLPILNINFLPQLGGIFTLIWAGGIVYAITKYGLMVLTPAYAASDILATMSDSLILISPENTIIEMNNAALKMLGYKSNEITGNSVEILFPESYKTFIENESEKFFKENSFRNCQDFLRTKNGEDIPVSFSISEMRDKEGNILGFVGIARDMRKILMLQNREKELATEKVRTEALQERENELKEAYDKLKAAQTMLFQSEKIAAVGQLAGGVAHEINNPMGVILGFAQSIVKRIKEDDPLYKPLKSIEREAVRCRKMIVDLLTFSRTGKTEVELININQAIDETLSLIEAQAKIKNIEIIKAYNKDLPNTLANKNQIQQVVVNLFNNAIDAMQDGGRITIDTKREGKLIEIDISDNGTGMSEEVKKHIFEPFFTTKEAGKGTGLGLSLCYEIIKKHNGEIEVSSEINKGTKFSIRLPLIDGDNE